jgi:hypothetical protein
MHLLSSFRRSVFNADCWTMEIFYFFEILKFLGISGIAVEAVSSDSVRCKCSEIFRI